MRPDANTERIRHYRKKHVGQRCFLIGNGPSLKDMDLAPLKDEVTFGFNRIYLLFEKIGFETTYLVVSNLNVIRQFQDDIMALRCTKFLSEKARDGIQPRDDIMFLKHVGGPDYPPTFSRDAAREVCGGGTVTYAAMQLAYYMGFEQVILIGVDHSFASKGNPNMLVTSQGDDPNHFHPDYFGKGVEWQLPDLERSELSYRVAKYQFERHGRTIVDATVGGCLNVFPKVPYASLLRTGSSQS